MDAISVVIPWDFPIDFGLGDGHFGVFPGSEPAIDARFNLGILERKFIVTVQAIQIGYCASPLPEKGCQVKQPQRFCPQVICSKVRNPGVDEQNERRL